MNLQLITVPILDCTSSNLDTVIMPGNFGFDVFNTISPGRFFAVNEIKLMLAFTLLRFDIKTKDGIRPPDWRLKWYILPNRTAEILFRKRKSISR